MQQLFWFFFDFNHKLHKDLNENDMHCVSLFCGCHVLLTRVYFTHSEQPVGMSLWKHILAVLAGTLTILLIYSFYVHWGFPVMKITNSSPLNHKFVNKDFHHVVAPEPKTPLENEAVPDRKNLVPKIVHFVRFGQPAISFIDLICIKAALLQIKPERLYIHSDIPPSGKYWEMLKHVEAMRYVHRDRPTEIFGKHISVVQHASDVARLEILMEYGGIYLDNDVYVCQPFDEFLNYTFTLGWPTKTEYIGNQILISTRNATFLHKYYDLYHQFDDSKWYYNAGELPTKAILHKDPDIAHTVPDNTFGVSVGLIYLIFLENVNWHKWHALHLLYRHRKYLTKDDPIAEHNPENIKKLNTTFGRMARLVYYGSENFVD